MTRFVLKNIRRLFDKYAVTRTEHKALVKSTTLFFQILWPSQKTQTLIKIRGFYYESGTYVKGKKHRQLIFLCWLSNLCWFCHFWQNLYIHFAAACFLWIHWLNCLQLNDPTSFPWRILSRIATSMDHIKWKHSKDCYLFFLCAMCISQIPCYFYYTGH